MLYFVKFICGFIIPPGGIITLLLILNIFMYVKKIRCKYLLSVIIAIFYLLTTPLVAFYLTKPLENAYPSYTIEEIKAQKPDAIIMLGGGAINNVMDIDGEDGLVSGSVANRMITVMRLQKELHIPVILSGGKVYEDTGREADIEYRIFKGMGIEENKLFLENQSRNTVENARFSKVIIEEKAFTKPVLITSAFHLPRSAMIFEREGIKTIPVATDYQLSGKIKFNIFSLSPGINSLYISCTSIREYLGILALKFSMQ